MTDIDAPSADAPATHAMAPIERFRRSAADATRQSGLHPSRHDALIREMVDHLTETWEAARGRGLTIAEATQYAGIFGLLVGAWFRHLGRHTPVEG
jgi:hypothetical protein